MKVCVGVFALAALAGAASAGVHTFPSSGSTVVASSGFLSPTEIGYFWTSARGDSVTETFSDALGSVSHLQLNMRVPTNVLSPGNHLDWKVKVNGNDVGMFTIDQGFTGSFTKDYDFAAVSGGSYTVRVEASSIVPGGGGSHTFGAAVDTTAVLTPAPGAAGLLGLAALAAGRRRRA